MHKYSLYMHILMDFMGLEHKDIGIGVHICDPLHKSGIRVYLRSFATNAQDVCTIGLLSPL